MSTLWRYPTHLLQISLLVVFVAAMTGCALSNTETARQLEAREFVVGGTIDMPGYLYIPRVSGHGMYGFGVGDISARAGSALLNYHAGLGLRLYPGEWLNFSLQGDISRILAPFAGGGDDWTTMLIVNPRISTAVQEGGLFYGGIQSNLIFTDPFGTSDANDLGLFGVLFGLDWLNQNNGVGIMTEVVLSPVALDLQEGTIASALANTFEDPSSSFEITFGVYWRRPPGGRVTKSMTPTELTEQEQVSTEARPQEEATTPVPELDYDEQGVPLY